jgi:hypothetical protein
MFDLLHRLDQLGFGVLDDELLLEGIVQGDVDVFVNGRGDHEAGMLAVVRRQVGAAASEGNAQRAASDDHARGLR